MYCVDCGESVQPGSSFCGKCGGKVGDPRSAPAPTPEPEEEKAGLGLRWLFVLWAFVQKTVGTAIVIFFISLGLG